MIANPSLVRAAGAAAQLQSVLRLCRAVNLQKKGGEKHLKQVFWLRFLELAIGSLLSAGLFLGGYQLLLLGVEANGSFDLKTSLLSGTITAQSAGFVMIFAGVIVFIAPLVFRAVVSPKRLKIRSSSSGLCPVQ